MSDASQPHPASLRPQPQTVYVQQAPPPAPKTSLGSEVYTGVATYGRFQAVIGAVFGAIIVLILIVIGVMALRDPHTASAPMTVTAVGACPQQTTSDGNGNVATHYLCTVTVQFSYGGTVYTVPNLSVTAPAPLAVGSAVTLRFDPRNPANVAQRAVSPRALGWGLIGGGLLLGGIVAGATVLSFKSKAFAAVEGTAGLLSAFRR